MELTEVKDYITEMYACGPEVEHVRGLLVCFEESADEGEDIPTTEQILEACEELVEEGVLQRAGREGFEATHEFMVERDLIR